MLELGVPIGYYNDLRLDRTGSDALASALSRRTKEVFSPFDHKRITQALELLQIISLDQEPRESGEPAISHALKAATNVACSVYPTQADSVIGALLHDTVEDRAEKIVELSGENLSADPKQQAIAILGRHFGSTVQGLVTDLTNPDFARELELLGIRSGSSMYKEKKRQLYTSHVEKIIRNNPYVLIIKYFDYADNAFHLNEEHWLKERDDRYKKYYPLIQLFMDQFESSNEVPISSKDRAAILFTLEQQQKSMGSELQRILETEKRYAA
jgi:(p)ppGpp synthase/HD superfamily hydrolase